MRQGDFFRRRHPVGRYCEVVGWEGTCAASVAWVRVLSLLGLLVELILQLPCHDHRDMMYCLAKVVKALFWKYRYGGRLKPALSTLKTALHSAGLGDRRTTKRILEAFSQKKYRTLLV